MPLGDLSIQFPFATDAASGGAKNYRRELDLDTAIARISFEHDGVRYVREVFVSHPGRAVIVRITADKSGKVSFTAGLSSLLRYETRAGECVLRMSGRAPMRGFIYSGKTREPIYDDESPEPKGMRWEAQLGATSEGGELRFTDDGLVAENCDAVTLMVVARTSYNGPTKSPSREGKDESALCREDLKLITGQTYDALRAAHVADYQELFHRVSLDLGHSAAAEALPTDERIRQYQAGSGADPGLAALYYQFGRYVLISASRPLSQPSNLQGIWNATINPAWGSNWTINCNAQINYWPVEAANLRECHQPLINMAAELSIDGARVAKEFYGARGWVSHHGTDIWKYASPVGSHPQWSNFVVSNAWLAQHLWEHYAFSMDVNDLRRAWPTIRGAAQFHLDMLVEEPAHKWLVTAPDINFENIWIDKDGDTGSLCMGSTPTMQMVRELFCNAIRAAKILREDADLCAELAVALPRLAPMQISPTTGQLQEYLEDWGRKMKAQVLSSWGAICSGQIHPRRTPELAAGLRKIFDTERWWEEKPDPLMGPCLGSWEGAFQANAYARLGDGDAALNILDLHLQKAVQPNLGSKFIGHAPNNPMFQIDGNLGQTCAINEMLLQSQLCDADGVYEIELLPSLPKSWASGKVRGLRARGGFQINITWRSGKLVSTRISSINGARTRIRYRQRTFDLTLVKGEQRELTSELGG
jgi:alpha-L-fucosidase 2